MLSLRAVLRPCSLALASSLLAACGGGGSPATVDSVAAYVDEETGSARVTKAFSINGYATSQPKSIQTLSWSVAPLTAGAADLRVANGDCSEAAKSSDEVNGSTESRWSCTAIVQVPDSLGSGMGAGVTYRFTLTGTDAAGNSWSQFRDVFVSTDPGPADSTAPVAITAGSIGATAGAPASLQCDGFGGTVAQNSQLQYEWVIKDNPSNVPLTLLPDQEGELGIFIGPMLASSTVTLQCRVMDDTPEIGVAETVMTISPSSTTTAVAFAGRVQYVASGATVRLDASASTAPGGAPLYYLWHQVSGPDVVLSDATAQRPTFVAPATTDATPLVFELIVSANAPVSEEGTDLSYAAATAVYVAPDQPMQLTINVPSTAKAGDLVTLNVTTAPGGDTLHYGWAQISGPKVTLRNATSATPSFVVPDGASGDILFTVRVARESLNFTLHGEAFSADAVVHVTP